MKQEGIHCQSPHLPLFKGLKKTALFNIPPNIEPVFQGKVSKFALEQRRFLGAYGWRLRTRTLLRLNGFISLMDSVVLRGFYCEWHFS